MLGIWRSHAEYQHFVRAALEVEKARNPHVLETFGTSILKLYQCDLDSVKTDLAKLFSFTGRPSNQQPEVFRAALLMADQREYDFDRWVKVGRSTPWICAAVGVTPDNFPGASTIRDFMSRLDMGRKRNPVREVKPKPKTKHGKEKLPPKNPGIIQKLADKALAGVTFSNNPEQLLNELFLKLAVKPSVNAGLIENPGDITVSADGTCIESHAYPNGRKTDAENFRRFTDPEANWGWDSSHERWFYGYTGYFLSTYNAEKKLDLPLYLRIEKASANDGVTLIKALADARRLWNGTLNIGSLLADAAHDNIATYNLLANWKIKAFIDLNPRYDITEANIPSLSKRGVPVCADGYEMVNWGFNKKRWRIKYRCPLAVGRVKYCPYANNCNKTPYGKTVYVRLKDSPRFLTPVPRDTDEWRDTYNRRTASERVNNRILTDYALERPKRYGRKKLTFFAFMNAINVHLDARAKTDSHAAHNLAA